ncbi:MAG: glutamine synthetase III [Flavobacteriales bacterium]|jgi:glutamine synthetase|nr:glutamine synthetase III [Flavobacteriales bacterium]
MPTTRSKAMQDVLHRKPMPQTPPSARISDYYGINVFSQHVMREYLTDEAYELVMAAIDHGTRIDRRVADQIASAMKDWSISRGATHYTHWFQPLTGATAEKHDSFIQPTGDGRAIEKFDGSLLVQQEPDASSFPNGGIRNTFEARGYTLWDPGSPAFIIGNTLCIPTIFIAYTGHALDYKMPLLKALSVVDKAATDVCQYFDKDVTKVNTTLGWEQEYFLIDKALFNARPDIAMTGRALFGHNPAKGQQLDDHYFGSIPERAMAFMKDFEQECHKIGIPVTTRHNEVAPNQFEVAPIFEEANLANDHNQLLMDILDRAAKKHEFRVLLHEKPFAGVNGSGKHNNWSLSTNTGVNLLKPGKNPKSNLRFLTFFVNTIMAIRKNADILRASIAGAGNDHRLGANEAPPAIISVFIGSQLSKLLDDLEKNIKAGKLTPADKTALKLEIGRIPEVLFDNTDRNRTSPFAFTGNKFEFRAVGSSANCANAMIALNTIMADQLIDFKKKIDARLAKGQKKDDAILSELQVMIKDSKSVRFEGNGYSDEWVVEAKKRGLSNLMDTPSALKVWKEKKVQQLFKDMNVLDPEELHARLEVELENYILRRQIEARVCADLAQNHIIPTAINYQTRLIENVRGLKDLMSAAEFKTASSTQMKLIKEISEHLTGMKSKIDELLEKRRKVDAFESAEKKAEQYASIVLPLMNDVREHVDRLEMLVDDELWPMPKLREILFAR